MDKIMRMVGWLLIVGGICGGAFAFWVVGSQDFVLALLARIVEDPFAYRSYVALLAAVSITLIGCLIGLLYLGLAQVMQNSSGKAS
jgi:hypothetical protein